MTRFEILRGELSVLDGAFRGRHAATDLSLTRVHQWIDEARQVLADVAHQCKTDSDLEAVTAAGYYAQLGNRAAELSDWTEQRMAIATQGPTTPG
jgi:hypothetical protein